MTYCFYKKRSIKDSLFDPFLTNAEHHTITVALWMHFKDLVYPFISEMLEEQYYFKSPLRGERDEKHINI